MELYELNSKSFFYSDDQSLFLKSIPRQCVLDFDFSMVGQFKVGTLEFLAWRDLESLRSFLGIFERRGAS